ncbi:TetR family transcriptional regulator C-terminal domain-containing protein [Streptomyces sp. NPDC001739]
MVEELAISPSHRPVATQADRGVPESRRTRFAVSWRGGGTAWWSGPGGGRDEPTRTFAVDLYDQLHQWVAGAAQRGIDSGEFTPTDVDELSTLVLALSDGYGIRLMMADPTVSLNAALTALWRQVAAALGLPPELPLT